MKKVKSYKLGRRILSIVLTTALVVGLMPGNMLTVSAEGIEAGKNEGVVVETVSSNAVSATTEFTCETDEETFHVTNGLVDIAPEKESGAWSEPTYNDGGYEIANASNLCWFAEHVNAGNKDANAMLTADIDMSGMAWTPICQTISYHASETLNDTGYSGTFDGKGHIISNLTVTFNSDTSNVYSHGLFGTVSGTVKNLGMVGFKYENKEGDTRAGSVAGQVLTGGTITNCYSVGHSITTNNNIAGGIAGCNYGGTISNCYALNGSVSGYSTRWGGVVGDSKKDDGASDQAQTYGTVSNCYTDNTRVVSSQNASGSIKNRGEVKDDAAFESGEVAYLLNGFSSENVTWHQTLKTDTYPVLDGEHGTVYRGYDKCKEVYANDVAGLSEKAEEHSGWTDGKCTYCGKTCSHIWTDDRCSICGLIAKEVGVFIVAGGEQNTDYSYSDGTLTIRTATALSIRNAAPEIPTTDKIKINSDVSANITLTGVNIDVSGQENTCAFEIAEGSTGAVTITLADDTKNILKSGKDCAGLQKEGETGSLVIRGETKGTGALVASGGLNGAGIGGGAKGAGTNITICGATVTAIGGSSAAGIGGGSYNEGNNIVITGGSVKAVAGNYGYAIGGGWSKSDVTPTTGGDSPKNVYPLAIANPESKAVVIDGVTYAPTNHIAADAEDTNLYVYLTGEEHKVRVGDVTTQYVFVDNAFYNSQFEKELTVTGVKETLVEGEDYDYKASGVLVIKTEKAVRIANVSSGTPTTHRIYVERDISANIILAGVNIDVSGLYHTAAFEIATNSTGLVTITLADDTENMLKSATTCAGLQKNGLYGSLVIQGETAGTGILAASGGFYGAGIGGKGGKSGSNITINGGIVTASGGDCGAGIGGGEREKGRNIVITGGSVKAVAGDSANNIGGGYGFEMVHPTLADGTTPVYPLEFEVDGESNVIIDKNKYPVKHFKENKLYVYLTATDHTVRSGDAEVIYKWDAENMQFIPVLTADNFTYTQPKGLVYTGKAAEIPDDIVVAKTIGTGSITVKYYDEQDNLVDVPAKAGTYRVKIDVSAGDKSVVEGITDESWTFVIAECSHTSAEEDGICDNCDYIEAPELEGEYYQIANAGQLYWFAEYVNAGNTSANAILTDDISVNGTKEQTNVSNYDGTSENTWRQWTPIGNTSKSYAGIFDGNEKTISGLYFNADQEYVGLFGETESNAEIKNVSVVNSYFKGTNYVGGVVGYSYYGTITNCHNAGVVEATATKDYNYVGGVIGSNTNSTITNCHNAGDITVTGTKAYVGGICGLGGGTIKNCYNTGNIIVTGERAYVGGVSGSSSGAITNCHNAGVIEVTVAEVYVGGVNGYNENGTITNCYNTGNVTATGNGSYVGGVNGNNAGGTIENCYNIGGITATGEYTRIGGVNGRNGKGPITNCYNEGNVTFTGKLTFVGGVNGDNESTIENCYNTGVVKVKVTGNLVMIGGVSGGNNSAITNCHNAGAVEVTAAVKYNVGSVSGENRNNGTITNCYYLDIEETDEFDGTTFKTAEQFASGEVAYLLNGTVIDGTWSAGPTDGTQNWYQTLGTDAYPVPDNTHGTVCYGYISCSENAKPEYTNQSGAQATKPGHVEGEEVFFTLDGEKAPTCTVDGIGHTECTKCKEPMQTNVTVEASGHTGETEVKDAKKATCAADGYTGDTYCKDCGTKIATGTKIAKTTNHVWDGGVVTKQPTSTEKGEKTYTCKVCKATKKEVISVLGIPKKGAVVKSDKATYKVTKSDLKNGTVAYVGPINKKATKVTIPATVKIDGITFKVTSVEKNAFKNNKKVKTVTIGKNVTTIGTKAFYGCSKLKTLKIKTTKLVAKKIGSKAFSKTPKSMKVTLPKKKFKTYKSMLIKKGVNKKAKFKKG